MTNRPQTIRVQDASRTLEFEGTMLSDVSTETDRNPRWTEMELYKVDDGRYVLSIVGRSVVFHEHDSQCNSGVPTQVSGLNPEMLEELEPCQRCSPPEPEDLAGTPTIDLEADRHTVHVCADANAVVEKLRNPKTTSANGTGLISGPGQRLLAIAASVDDGIKNAVTVVDRI